MNKLKTRFYQLFAIFIAVISISSCQKDDLVFVHEFGSFTDSRDGHVYKTIEIGAQTWLAENLSFGGAGREITPGSEWDTNTSADGWCYYLNDKNTYGDTYGILYQWEAAKNACPDGWHLPSNGEWDQLSGYLGGAIVAGGKLKEAGTTNWQEPNSDASNESGFTALPGGIRPPDLGFYDIGERGIWWSSTENPGTPLYYRSLSRFGGSITDCCGLISPRDGISVRCLKD